MPFHAYRPGGSKKSAGFKTRLIVCLSLLGLVFIVVLLSVITADNKAPKTYAETQQEPIPKIEEKKESIDPIAHAFPITAKQLQYEYEQNEVVADNKYKGRTLAVAGKITNISKNAFDEIYITMSTGNMFSFIHCEGLSNAAASQLFKGQKATFIGTCNGLFMGSVFIKDCTWIIVPKK